MISGSRPLKLRRKLAAIEDHVDGVKVEDLGLDFTVPGYDIELKVSMNHTVSSNLMLTTIASLEAATSL